MNEPTRRDFLRAAGFVGGGALFSGGLAGALLAGGPASAAEVAPWDQIPLILARITPPTFPNRTFDIRDYGAVGDNTTDCTPAFKAAIAACNAAGGGRVLVPGVGKFRTGKIHLLSNVDLHVESGGTIRFRSDAGSFLPNVFTRWQGIECYNYSPFIYAYNQTNVAITGPGIIDGNAAAGPWFGFDSQRGPDWDALQQQAVDGVPINQRQYGAGHYLKPNMIQLYKCTNVLIADVDVRNAAMWSVHPVLCTNVTVRNIKVLSRGAMVDGCDPESCTDVHIIGCRFDTGDDGIAIKSGRDTDGRRVGVASQNIVIQNCTFLGRWGAVTVGSEMSGGVRNVYAEDCTIAQGSSYKSFHALYIKTNQRRGGVIDNINVRRISGGPVDRGVIHIDMNYSLTGPGFGPIVYPTVGNVLVESMNIDTSPYFLRISGIAASPFNNLRIANSTFTHITTATPSISNANNVTYTNTTVNGVPIGGGGTTTRYEAENATISQGVVESNHTGFSGTGFVNTDNIVGSYVEWTVTGTAGPATLRFRHANGTTANRPASISVNGSVVNANLAFNPTGAWTTWATVTIAATLVGGTNTIRITSTTATGCANLDYLEVVQ